MSTIYSSTADCRVVNTSASSWASAQGDASTTGTAFSSDNTSYNFGIYNLYSGGRGGNTFYCSRSYFVFDLSGEDLTKTLSRVRLNIYMDNLGTTGAGWQYAVPIRATALAGSTADFGNCYTSGTTFGTKLADAEVISTTAQNHTFEFNAESVGIAQSLLGNGTLTLAVIGNYADYLGNVPPLGGYYAQVSFRYADYSGTGSDPFLDLTYYDGTTNSVFFGTNF